jgi:hypothetical protein
MKSFPNPEFPISNADCAEIEAMFIDLMRQRDAATDVEAETLKIPTLDPPDNAEDLRSQWGLQ